MYLDLDLLLRMLHAARPALHLESGWLKFDNAMEY